MVNGVQIVIVTYRPPEGMLERALRSVLETTDRATGHETIDGATQCEEMSIEVCVVDNGGRAADVVAGVSADTGRSISVIRQPNNGFGAAANIGVRVAREAGNDLAIVLNDDVEVTDGWLDPLIAEFDDPEVGAAQPLLVTPSGDAIDSAGVELDRFGAGSDVARGLPVDSIGQDACDLAVFTGGAVALRCEFLVGVGGFDERFFLYYEDVELARRGAARGWRYRLVPASRVRHAGSATTAAMGDEIVQMRERNRLWSSAMTGSASELAAALWLSVRRVRHRPRRAHTLGLLTGAAGIPTRLAARVRRSGG